MTRSRVKWIFLAMEAVRASPSLRRLRSSSFDPPLSSPMEWSCWDGEDDAAAEDVEARRMAGLVSGRESESKERSKHG
jgi:hypothetical protein